LAALLGESMKITKQKLNNIIKHELKSIIKEAKAFALSSKHMPVRPIGAKITGIADPDTDADDADELRSGLNLSGFKLKKMQGMYAIVDANTDEVVLGPFRTEAQAQDRMSDPSLASDYEAAKQIMSTRAGDYSLSEKKLKALKEADDYINPTGMGGSSRWEKTGRMRPHYTSHGADYERFEPTYKITSDHPDHPDYKKPPSKEALMRGRCRKQAEASVYDRRFDGHFDRDSGDPANVETVYTRCMQLEAFTPGRKSVEYQLDEYFKDEPWYKDDRERRDQYWEVYYKLSPAQRAYMSEGKTNMKITKQELHQIITEELTNALVSLREVSTKVNWEQIAKTYEAHLSKQSDVKNPKKVVYDNIKIAKDDPSGEEAGLNKLASQLKSTYGFDIVQQ
jgi:hypothetical protein